MDNNKKILATLCYSDVFDYPLTASELWYYLHTRQALDEKEFATLLQTKKGFAFDGTYFFLPNREAIVQKRKSLTKINEQKMQNAKKIALLLRLIPTIVLIGVSGSVAIQSAEEDDDIDLFFITRPASLWLTRLIVFLFLRSIGLARKRQDTKAKNKICANMFVESSSLLFSPKRQNVYTAHEIAQLQVLFDRKSWHQEFLQANSWMQEFLFHASGKKETQRSNQYLWYLLFPFEYLAQKIQWWYMKKHRTREEVSKGLLAFHPIPYDRYILKKYEERKKVYGI